MALAGLYVVAGYAGNRGGGKIIQPLLSKITSTGNINAKGVVNIVGPVSSDTQGQPMMRFYATVDYLIQLSNANAADTNWDHVIPAGQFVDIFVPDSCQVSGAPA